MREGGSAGRHLRRVLGLALAVFAVTPVFFLLEGPETGLPGSRTVSRAWTLLRSSWWGGVLMLGGGLALATILPVAGIRRGLARVGTALRRPTPGVFALGLGAVSLVLAAAASRLIFAGLPTLEDGMASLVHARYLAAGEGTGTLPEPGAGWLIPNTLVTAEGWVSQYPPLHLLLLAGGLRIGAVWLVGPVLLGVTVALTARVAELALERRPATARTGAILTALSPFLIFLGAGYLSHTSAAAFGALALYAALRAEGGDSALWPVLTGLAAGGAVASRPWTGLFLGVLLPAGLWAVRSGWVRGGAARPLARRLGLAALGGAPAAAALGAYNHHFFGHPLRFGYTAAYGGAHLPGFHRDPWGNVYGPAEALGYTAADLTALGVHLLETPLSAVLVVGAGLLAARRLPRGTWVLLAWALLPVAANALYWHHGFHLGPRMLFEAAPAWCILTAVTAGILTGGAHAGGANEGEVGDGRDPPSEDAAGRSRSSALGARARDAVLGALLLSVPVGIVLAVERARSYRWPAETLSRIQPPRAPAGPPALVFVHGGWTERISGRLLAAGMPGDSVETAFRRNGVCAVHRYAEWRYRREEGREDAARGSGDAGDAAPRSAPPELDLRTLPGRPPSLEPVEVAPGYVVWRDPGRRWGPECRREAMADRSGVVSLAPLLWQGDLPGIEEGQPLFVRDLGPEENRRLFGHYPNRYPYLFASGGLGKPAALQPYREEVQRIWGSPIPNSVQRSDQEQ